MKRIVVIFLCFLLFEGLSAESPQNGFRGFQWNIAKSDIIKKEGEPTQVVDDSLIYNSSIAGKNAVLFYRMVEDKLISGGYLFEIKHVNKNLYIEDFEDLKKQLVEKYGEPEVYDINWSNDLYKDNPSHWGKAISYGYLEYLAIWNKDNTRIILWLHGDNYEIDLSLSYASKEYLKHSNKNVDENL